MNIQAALTGLVDLLKTTGLQGTDDNTGVNAPCFFVHTGPINASTLGDGYVMTAQVTLIAPNTSRKGNLKALQDMLTLALNVVEPDGPIDPNVTAEIVANKPLPAITFPVNLDL